MPTNLSWRRLGRACLLAAVVGLAFWLRIGQATESLWLDELHTAWVVADGAEQLTPRALVGNYSPVYFALVWAVAQAAGFSELSLRLPSILAGTALVICVSLVVRRWTGCWSAGLLAAMLVALDRHCVFYAQEARPYALVQLVGLVHVVVFGCLLQRARFALRLTWVATGVLLFYLHYTAVLLLAGEVVCYGLLWVLARFPLAGASGLDGAACSANPRAVNPLGYRWTQLAADLIVLGLCLVPAVPHLREIAQRRQDWGSFVPPRSLGRFWEIADVFPLGVYLLAPVAILAAAWISAQFVRRRSAAAADRGTCDLRWLLLVLCWFLVPLTVAWTVTALGHAPLFFRRYLMVVAVGPIVASALCYAACSSAVWRAALAVVVVGLSLWRGGMVSQWRQDGRVVGDRNQDWRSAVQDARRQAPVDTPVFVRSGLIEAERWYASPDPLRREYCLLPILGLYRLAQRREDLFPLPVRPPAVLSAAAGDRVRACGQAWCLVQGSERSVARFEADLRSGWRRAGLNVVTVRRHSFRDVAVLQITARALSPPP